MQQWWEALEQLFALLQDSDALGLSREARKRLISAIGALDNALLNCAQADCPIRSTIKESESTAAGAPTQLHAVQAQTDVTAHTCRSCRWWNPHRRGTEATEGACMLTRTEATGNGAPRPIITSTLARAAATDEQVGAVLLTHVPYACSQWAPL